MNPRTHKSQILRSLSYGFASILLATLLVFVFAGIGLARPLGTDVTGSIDAPITWNLAGSPYVLTGDVSVSPGVTLTVEPDVPVKGNSKQVSEDQTKKEELLNSVSGTVYPNSTTPANDAFDTAIEVAGIFYSDQVDTRGATVASDDPTLSCPSGQRYNTVWYHFVPSVESTVSIDTFGSTYDTVLAVWVGSRNALQSVGCNDDSGGGLTSKLLFTAQTNKSYYIEVASYRSGGGDLNITISGTTWSAANSPYVLTRDVTVSAGVTLTVEPGVVVKGNTGVELQVLGHLEAVGTESQPITFTSSSDSGPGQWTGLVFDGGTGNLVHTTVRYGGYYYNSLLPHVYYGSNIAARNVLTGEVRIESSQVISQQSNYGSTDYGLYIENSRVVVSDTIFSGNGNSSSDYVLYMTGGNTFLDMAGSTIQNNTGRAAEVDAGYLHQVQLNGNIVNNNGSNRVRVNGGEIVAPVTLTPNGFEGYELVGDLTVPVTWTLTVEPGVVVMGGSGVELQVKGHLEAVGTESQPITFTSATDSGPGQWSGLVFDGGTGNLVHTTVRYGGRGYNSILSNYSYGSNIAVRDVLTGEVRIESSQVISQQSNYGGTDYGLYVENSRVAVSDTFFSGNGNSSSNDYALYATGVSTATIKRSHIINNAGHGLYLASSSTPSVRVTNSAIHDNGNYGISNDSPITVTATSNWWGDPSGPGGVGPGSGDEVSSKVQFDPWLPLNDLRYSSAAQVIDGGDIKRWNSLAWTPVDPVTVTVRVGNTPAPAVFDLHWSNWYTFTALPVDLSALPPSRYLEWRILSTTVPDPSVVVLDRSPFTYTKAGGLITSNTTWSAAQSPYLVTSSVLVGEGFSLTVEPGVEVWFKDQTKLQVGGGLLALGDPTRPITFTSWHVQKQPDDWWGIAFDNTAVNATFAANGAYLGGSTLQHLLVEYAGHNATYAVDAPGTTLYVEGSAIQHNGAGGLRSVGGVISRSTVSHNTTSTSSTTGGIYNSGGGLLTYNRVMSNTASSGGGGGIYSSGGGRLDHNTVTGNSINSGDGGGIYSSGGGRLTANIVIDNRTSSGNGGGIYSADSAVLEGNTVADNTTLNGRGGGIYSSDGGRIEGNTVSNNLAMASTTYGGGIYSVGSATIRSNSVMTNTAHSNYTGNSGEAAGGGIFAVDAIAEYNQIQNNTASHAVAYNAYGGGLYIRNGLVRDNTIEGNTARLAGGLFVDNSSVWGNSIRDNHAQENVGGVYWWTGSNLDLRYNTITNNTTAGTVGGVYLRDGYPWVQYNAIHDNSGSFALYNSNGFVDIGTQVDARFNWWDITDPAVIADLNYDTGEDSAKSPVNANDALESNAPLVVVAEDVFPLTAGIGQPVTYTVSLLDRSPGLAATVHFSAVLPAGLTFLSGSGDEGLVYTAGSRVITWSGSLRPGQELPVRFAATVNNTNALSSRISLPVYTWGDGVSGTATATATVTVGQVIYTNGFEGSIGDGWSRGNSTVYTDTTPSGRRFLGQFGNDTVSLNLDRLPRHENVTVSFDLFIIRSWDGNCTSGGPDIWELKADNNLSLLRTTFANWMICRQSYPDSYPGGAFPRQTSAVAVNALGYGSLGWGDATYRLSYTFPHTSTNLALRRIQRIKHP